MPERSFSTVSTCPRCRQPYYELHSLPDCVHNIAVYNQNRRAALHVVADYANDLRRNWPRHSAQDRQLSELCMAIHTVARAIDDDDDLPGGG